jgi:hypothetical protein
MPAPLSVVAFFIVFGGSTMSLSSKFVLFGGLRMCVVHGVSSCGVVVNLCRDRTKWTKRFAASHRLQVVERMALALTVSGQVTA